MKYQKTGKRNAWKVLGITVVTIIAVPFILYILLDLNYIRHINDLAGKVERIGQESVRSISGIKQSAGARCPQLIDAVLQADAGPCPEYGYSWLVLIEPNQEDGFIKSALQKADYMGLSKKGLDLNMTFYGTSGTSLPYSAPGEKRWRILDISIADHVDSFQTIFFPSID